MQLHPRLCQDQACTAVLRTRMYQETSVIRATASLAYSAYGTWPGQSWLVHQVTHEAHVHVHTHMGAHTH